MADVTFTLPREFAERRSDPAPVVRIIDGGANGADGLYTPPNPTDAAHTDRIEINGTVYDPANDAHRDALRYLYYVLVNPPPNPFTLESFNQALNGKSLERMARVFANVESVRLQFAIRRCPEGNRLYNDSNAYSLTGNVGGFIPPAYFVGLQEFICSGLTGSCARALGNIEYCTDPNPWAHVRTRPSNPIVATPTPTPTPSPTSAVPPREVSRTTHRQANRWIPRDRPDLWGMGSLTQSNGGLGGLGGFGIDGLRSSPRRRPRVYPARPPHVIRLVGPRTRY